MSAASIDVYVGAFVARCDTAQRPDQAKVDEPGLQGLLSSSTADPQVQTRLLVVDDRAYDALAELLPDAQAGSIRVFAAATRCAQLLKDHPAWKSETSTAMVCHDLHAVPAAQLPSGLTVRAVRRLADDALDGVQLADAVAAAMLSDPAIDLSADAFAEFLRSLPAAIRLFVAVDGNDVVRATAGSGVFGAQADVIFVNTIPGWRGRGIGRAMTTTALPVAEDQGARQACLNATGAGLRVYRRLGFKSIGQTTFFRAV